MTRPLGVLVVAAAALAGGPAQAGPAQGLSCGLGAGVVWGGPVVFSGEIATSVTYRCVVRVSTATGVTERVASFDSAGPVGVLPPAAVVVGPGATRVEVCTHLEWVFGFPGGGGVDAGCRDAVHGPTGWELVPEVVA